MASLSIYNTGRTTSTSDKSTTNRGTKERVHVSSTDRSQRAYKAWETRRKNQLAAPVQTVSKPVQPVQSERTLRALKAWETKRKNKAKEANRLRGLKAAATRAARMPKRTPRPVKVARFAEGDRVITKSKTTVRRENNLLTDYSLHFEIDRRSRMRFIQEIKYIEMSLVYIMGNSWRNGYALIATDAIEPAKA